MSKNPLNFGVSGIFGRMGQNPSINALTNANSLAQQQLAQQNIQPLGSGTTYKPDMSQQVMTGSFDPLTQQVGMGVFGDANARNRSLYPSALMAHDKLGAELKDLEARQKELIEEFGVGSDPVLEQESRIMDKKRDIEAAKKEHKKQ